MIILNPEYFSKKKLKNGPLALSRKGLSTVAQHCVAGFRESWMQQIKMYTKNRLAGVVSKFPGR
jgi:hypothetical protein